MATETHESTEAAGHGGGGGLPQFDLQWWPGTIAWTLIVFAVILAFMRFIAVPRIGGTIADRDDRIAGDIARARQLKAEADAQAEAAAAERAKARADAQKLAQDSRTKARAEVAERLAEEEARLAESTGKAEAAIFAARDKAMANVGDIAAQTALVIVEKLTGRAASAAEAAGIRGGRG